MSARVFLKILGPSVGPSLIPSHRQFVGQYIFNAFVEKCINASLQSVEPTPQNSSSPSECLAKLHFLASSTVNFEIAAALQRFSSFGGNLQALLCVPNPTVDKIPVTVPMPRSRSHVNRVGYLCIYI